MRNVKVRVKVSNQKPNPDPIMCHLSVWCVDVRFSFEQIPNHFCITLTMTLALTLTLTLTLTLAQTLAVTLTNPEKYVSPGCLVR